jgi:hypothetical protein
MEPVGALELAYGLLGRGAVSLRGCLGLCNGIPKLAQFALQQCDVGAAHASGEISALEIYDGYPFLILAVASAIKPFVFTEHREAFSTNSRSPRSCNDVPHGLLGRGAVPLRGYLGLCDGIPKLAQLAMQQCNVGAAHAGGEISALKVHEDFPLGISRCRRQQAGRSCKKQRSESELRVSRIISFSTARVLLEGRAVAAPYSRAL